MKFKKKLSFLLPQLSVEWLLYNVLLSSVLFGVVIRPTHAGNYCDIKATFNLPAVTPMWEEEIPVVGCFSKHTTPRGQEVHVLHLKSKEDWSAPKVVTIHIRPADDHSLYKKSFILLLHSDFTVSWKLVGERLNNSTYHRVILTQGSQIIENRDMQLTIHRRYNGNIKSLLAWLNKRYKSVTSYVKIENANYLHLSLGVKNDEVPARCEITSHKSVPHITAFSQVNVPIVQRKGCVARCNYKSSNRIVHIIKINESNINFNNGEISTVKIYIHSRMNHFPDREMVLVLKASLPVEWILINDGTKGRLTIISERVIVTPKNVSPPDVTLRTEQLSNDTDNLMSGVINWFGPSFTYTKVARANAVRIFLDGTDEEGPPPKLVEFYSTNMHRPRAIGNRDMVRSHLRHGHTTRVGSESHILANSRRPLNANDIIRMPSVMLYDVMIVECLPQYMRVSFPRISMEQLGLQPEHITLTDPRCIVSVNATHYVLSSTVDACGTKKDMDNDRVIYKNAVHFRFQVQKIGNLYSSLPDIESSTLPIDDEDSGDGGSGSSALLESSDAKTLEFQCEFQPMSELASSLTASRELFSIKLSRDPSFTRPITNLEYPLVFSDRDRIYVETRLIADGDLQVVTEDCWLSENEDPKVGSVSELITNGCSTGSSIQFESSSNTISNRFSFQLDAEYTKFTALFLHCKLGICTIDQSQSNKRGLKLCIDSKNVCKTDSLKSYLEVNRGTHHNIFSRGPIKVNKRSMNPKKPFTDVPFKQQGKLDVEVLAGETVDFRCTIPESQPIIVIGLSTESVVGIAFASFIIGLALAAVLWLIYVKTDPLRNIHNQPSRHNHSGYDLSAHSGSSTPNSQSPMTA